MKPSSSTWKQRRHVTRLFFRSLSRLPIAATKTMIDRTEQCFDLKPKRLAADTTYGTGRFLGWPHIPVRDKSDRDDCTFSRSDFLWDKRRGHYICPNGKVLRTSGTIHGGRTLLYRASKLDCDVCHSKPSAARKHPRERSRVISTRMPATWRVAR